MSLTMYIFKPYLNIIMMCAMNFIDEDDEVLNEDKVCVDKKENKKIAE